MARCRGHDCWRRVQACKQRGFGAAGGKGWFGAATGRRAGSVQSRIGAEQGALSRANSRCVGGQQCRGAGEQRGLEQGKIRVIGLDL
ncbi:hypothetical protein SLEP1_g26245 [Rubroshorea leprosula]|uniref:Uncharacterized protein n=1 Tax=Rubroshorea leprosula TaxID=152421 RepID=A0AAV5JRW3_9ROSI|nr:hypothetical protein SLEP1_g26245 [Rubroshorea leprosula]